MTAVDDPRRLGPLEPCTWLGIPVRRYPPRARTLGDALDRGVRRWPDRPLVVGDAGTLTYREFAARVDDAAAALAAAGVGRADRVAVCLPNGAEIAVAIWACVRLRAVFVGLSSRLPAEGWAYQLEHSRAALCVTDDESAEDLRAAARRAGLPESRVVRAAEVLAGTSAGTGGRAAGRPPWDTAAVPDDEAYAVVYTSGTTGRPKAIRLTHHGTMQAGEHYVRALALGPDDRTAVTFPFYYLSGHVTQLNPAMLSGGSVVPLQELSPRAVVESCARHDVTWLDIVPSLLALLPRLPEFSRDRLPALRLAVYGGSPVLPGMAAALRAAIPDLALVDAYGLTETAVAFCCLYDDEHARKPGSVGRPIPTAQVRLVDDAGRVVAGGEVGELQVRGPFLSTGYDGDEEATAEAFVDGWFRTGDAARVDDDGYVYVVDRIKDMVIRSGQKIFPAEVEAVLTDLPEVAEAAVFGIPDPRQFEVVGVWVVPADGQVVEPAKVRRAVRERVAEHAVPSVVRVVDALPRVPTGKVDKRAMRAATPRR